VGRNEENENLSREFRSAFYSSFFLKNKTKKKSSLDKVTSTFIRLSFSYFAVHPQFQKNKKTEERVQEREF
jgi:hypothetical protein